MTGQPPFPISVPRLATLSDTIVTPNLVITPLQPKDLLQYRDSLRETWDEMNRWVRWATEPQEPTIAKNVETSSRHFLQFRMRTAFFMVAREQGADEIASFVTLYNVRNDGREMEAGYWTRKKYMGRGLTTEAMTGLLKWGFDEVGAHSMTANHPEGHEASGRTLKKIGFVSTGVSEEKIAMPDGRELRDVNCVLDDASRIPALDVIYQRNL